MLTALPMACCSCSACCERPATNQRFIARASIAGVPAPCPPQIARWSARRVSIETRKIGAPAKTVCDSRRHPEAAAVSNAASAAPHRAAARNGERTLARSGRTEERSDPMELAAFRNAHRLKSLRIDEPGKSRLLLSRPALADDRGQSRPRYRGRFISASAGSPGLPWPLRPGARAPGIS